MVLQHRYSSWDVYDLWADRMDNSTANAIIQGGGSRPINMTAMGGAGKVYAQTPLPATKALMGSKVGSVKPSGSVQAHVRSHGVAMLRLREVKTNDELGIDVQMDIGWDCTVRRERMNHHCAQEKL